MFVVLDFDRTLKNQRTLPCILSSFMVGTRKQRFQHLAMERARLESATLEELRQEAARYQLSVTATTDRDLLIETIVKNLENNSPMEEMLPPAPRSRTHSERSRKGSVQSDAPGPSQAQAPVSEAGFLNQLAITLGVFVEQQRQMLEEMRHITRRNSSVREEALPVRRREKLNRSPAISASSPAQAVTLLAPQIPEFGGTDEENVHIWTQRVDRVAQVHRASDDVVLLAVY